MPERVWRTAQQKYLRLLPEAIGVHARGQSLRLERARTDFGCEHLFAHAAAQVYYGFEISARVVRDATLLRAERAGYEACATIQGTLSNLAGGGSRARHCPGRWHVDLHGGARETNKGRGSGKKCARRPRKLKERPKRCNAATIGKVAAVGRRWGHCARRAGWGLNSQIHALGDGAGWIRLQTREVFGEQ